MCVLKSTLKLVFTVTFLCHHKSSPGHYRNIRINSCCRSIKRDADNSIKLDFLPHYKAGHHIFFLLDAHNLSKLIYVVYNNALTMSNRRHFSSSYEKYLNFEVVFNSPSRISTRVCLRQIVIKTLINIMISSFRPTKIHKFLHILSSEHGKTHNTHTLGSREDGTSSPIN